MAITKSALRSRVRTNMKIDPKGRIWWDSDVNDAINTALLEIQKDWSYNWQENQTETSFPTVVDTQEYSLPVDLQRIRLVRNSWSILDSTTKENLKRVYKEFTGGTPTQYYVSQNVLWLHPFPKTSETVDITYNKRLPELVNDTDELPYPDDFIVAIVNYAAYDLFSSIWNTENLNRAAIRKNRYDEEQSKLVNTYLAPDKWELLYKSDYPYANAKATQRTKRF